MQANCVMLMSVRRPILDREFQTEICQIGINLGDPVFKGEYHGTQRHEDDFDDVLKRGLDAGCQKFMVTGSDLKESEHAIEIAKAHRRYQIINHVQQQ